MKNNKLIAILICFFITYYLAGAPLSLPFNDFFSSTSPSATNWYSSGMSNSAGATIACAAGNYCCYANGSGSWMMLKETKVNSVKDVVITFKCKKYGTYSGTPSVYIHLGKATLFNGSSPANDGFIKLGDVTTFACGNNSFTIPYTLIGAQEFVVAIYFPGSSSSTNGVQIDDFSATESGVYSLTPVSTSAWTENFQNGKWYNTSAANLAANVPYVKTGYRSKYNSTGSDIYLYTGGANGT